MWHEGYWGLHVGYYGGINYGYGYGGIGFIGGQWRGGVFAYNTAVVNVNRTNITNVYVNKTVINNTIVNNNHVAYNGGPGGINHEPTPRERTFSQEQHTPPTSFQTQHQNRFQNEPGALAKNNGGHPQRAALSSPITHNTSSFGTTASRGSFAANGNSNATGNKGGASSPQLNNSHPVAQNTAGRPGQFSSASQYRPNAQSQYHSNSLPQNRPNQQPQNRPQSQNRPQQKQRHSNASPSRFRR